LIGFFLTMGFAVEQQPKLVIVDNGFNGPPWSLTNLRAALIFLESPEVKVLGFTVVTGDGWRDEEVYHMLRLLEIAGHQDIPVVAGAVFPLVIPRRKPRLGKNGLDLSDTRAPGIRRRRGEIRRTSPIVPR
jgi:purine nucleosidase